MGCSRLDRAILCRYIAQDVSPAAHLEALAHVKDNPPAEDAVPAWAQVLINAVYVVGAVVGLLVGVYGLYLLVAGVIIVEGIDLVGLALGLLFIVAGFGLLSLSLNLLFVTGYRGVKYKPRTWVAVLLGSAGIGLLGYFVFVSLRGI